MNITFDPERHAYTVNGAAVPSVSRVCDLVDPPSSFYRPEHATRGKYVHAACEFADQRALKESALDPALKPYLDGWRAFLRDTGAEVLGVEIMVASSYGYAGRLDRVVRLPGRSIGIVDIKSGDPGIRGPLQTSAYMQAARETLDIKPAWRAAVQLFPTGDYRVHYYENEADLDAFLAALAVLRWKESTA